MLLDDETDALQVRDSLGAGSIAGVAGDADTGMYDGPLPTVSPPTEAGGYPSGSDRGDEDSGVARFGCERPIDYNGLIVRVYELYNPEKLSEVPSMISKFPGGEEALFQRVCEKYGVNPDHAAIVGADRLEGTPLDAKKAEQKEAGQEAANSQNGALDYRELITKVYKQCNPEKVADIPAILEKYAGRENALYIRICEKYSISPDVAAVAIGEKMADPPPVPKAEPPAPPPGRRGLWRTAVFGGLRKPAAPPEPKPGDHHREMQEVLGQMNVERDAALQTVHTMQIAVEKSDALAAIMEDERDEARLETAHYEKRLAFLESNEQYEDKLREDAAAAMNQVDVLRAELTEREDVLRVRNCLTEEAVSPHAAMVEKLQLEVRQLQDRCSDEAAEAAELRRLSAEEFESPHAALVEHLQLEVRQLQDRVRDETAAAGVAEVKRASAQDTESPHVAEVEQLKLELRQLQDTESPHVAEVEQLKLELRQMQDTESPHVAQVEQLKLELRQVQEHGADTAKQEILELRSKFQSLEDEHEAERKACHDAELENRNLRLDRDSIESTFFREAEERSRDFAEEAAIERKNLQRLRDELSAKSEGESVQLSGLAAEVTSLREAGTAAEEQVHELRETIEELEEQHVNDMWTHEEDAENRGWYQAEASREQEVAWLQQEHYEEMQLLKASNDQMRAKLDIFQKKNIGTCAMDAAREAARRGEATEFREVLIARNRSERVLREEVNELRQQAESAKGLRSRAATSAARINVGWDDSKDDDLLAPVGGTVAGHKAEVDVATSGVAASDDDDLLL
eukprot:TRINITY_DN4861_c0_g1_i2.p1 TRINITY_DN4861_c0_g1~~TRINITY_DN4861_c0_g1_i2.p1  ORF type:complete len:801 (-),score=198.05 TRINITY_DN4861_c0_g1_i2:149-2551(-)